MRSFPLAALALVAVVALAACGGGAASPSAAPSASQPPSASPSAGAPGGVTAEDLEGRVFIVTGADGHELVEGSEVTLGFEGGQLGISAGCNQMSGAFAIEDGRLALGDLVTTEMACDQPLMDQDAWIGAFLPDATLALDGDTLTIAKDGVTLTATDKEVARPDRPLVGTTWVVDGLVTNQAVSSMPMGVTATLTFGEGTVEVASGCNTGSGSVVIGDTTIEFGPIGTTKMACEGAAMEVERHVLAALQGDVGYRIDSDTLQLSGAGGGLLLKAQS